MYDQITRVRYFFVAFQFLFIVLLVFFWFEIQRSTFFHTKTPQNSTFWQFTIFASFRSGYTKTPNSVGQRAPLKRGGNTTAQRNLGDSFIPHQPTQTTVSLPQIPKKLCTQEFGVCRQTPFSYTTYKSVFLSFMNYKIEFFWFFQQGASVHRLSSIFSLINFIPINHFRLFC